MLENSRKDNPSGSESNKPEPRASRENSSIPRGFGRENLSKNHEPTSRSDHRKNVHNILEKNLGFKDVQPRVLNKESKNSGGGGGGDAGRIPWAANWKENGGGGGGGKGGGGKDGRGLNVRRIGMAELPTEEKSVELAKQKEQRGGDHGIKGTAENRTTHLRHLEHLRVSSLRRPDRVADRESEKTEEAPKSVSGDGRSSAEVQGGQVPTRPVVRSVLTVTH